MKILHTVESYLPAEHGMSEVVKQLSQNLVLFGHDVTVATKFDSNRKVDTINGVKIVDFKISGNEVFGYIADKTEIDRYQKFLLNSDFDVITNFAAQQWATDLMLLILDKIKAKKVFVPTGFSALYLPLFKEYYEKMKNWMKLYDMNVFLSEDYRDVNFAKRNGVIKIQIIPNGASKKEFETKSKINIREQLKIPKKNFLILLVGSHTGLKGHEEALKIFKKAKINNATLLIVGKYGEQKNFFDKLKIKIKRFLKRKVYYCEDLCCRAARKKQSAKKQILIKDLNREEIVACYHEADLFLFPSNVECSPIVLFECLASQTPFLVTDVGNSAEIIKWTGGGQLLPTTKNEAGLSFAKIDESAVILEKLFYDQKTRSRLAESGHKAWSENFTWEIIAKRYEKLYQSLINQ